MTPHDCWNPACIRAQRGGQSCALCLGCQIIRDALHAGVERDQVAEFPRNLGELSESELEQLKAHALEAQPGICAVEARELLELISGYRRGKVPRFNVLRLMQLAKFDARELDSVLETLVTRPEVSPEHRARLRDFLASIATSTTRTSND